MIFSYEFLYMDALEFAIENLHPSALYGHGLQSEELDMRGGRSEKITSESQGTLRYQHDLMIIYLSIYLSMLTSIHVNIIW